LRPAVPFFPFLTERSGVFLAGPLRVVRRGAPSDQFADWLADCL